MQTKKKTLTIAGRVDADIKELFVKESEERGISQQELLQEALVTYFNQEPEPTPLPEPEPVPAPIDDLDLDPEETEDEPFTDPEEEPEPEEEAAQGLFALFPPLMAAEINCAIVKAWQEVDQVLNPSPISDLLLELADDLEKEAFSPRKYECQDDDYQEILPELAIDQVDRILTDAKAELGETSDKETIFRTIAQFCYEKSDNLYQTDRSITLEFTRYEWLGLDKIVTQANKYREDGQPLDLETLIRLKLGETMEELGQGFFGPRDKQLCELSQEFQKV